VAASAFMPEAVEKLRRGKGRPENKPLALAFPSSASVLQRAPDMSPLARRLARRCWPGPVTLVLAFATTDAPSSRLPEGIRRRVCAEGTMGLRVPDHEGILQVLRRLAAPLVLTSANRSGGPAATNADEVIRALPSDLALVIDDGPTRYRQAS